MPLLSVVRRAPPTSFFAVAYGASLVALVVIDLPSLHPTGGVAVAPLIMFPQA